MDYQGLSMEVSRFEYSRNGNVQGFSRVIKAIAPFVSISWPT